MNIVEDVSIDCRNNDKHQYKCNKCGNKFVTSNRLETHMLLHHTRFEDTEFKCVECRKTFLDAQGLNSHMRMHKNYRPFVCPHKSCNKSFTNKKYLTNHQNTHSKVFVTCDVCNKDFTRKPDLERHMRTHTGEKPYKCHLCPKSFNTYHRRKSHIQTHSKDNNVHVEAEKIPVKPVDNSQMIHEDVSSTNLVKSMLDRSENDTPSVDETPLATESQSVIVMNYLLNADGSVVTESDGKALAITSEGTFVRVHHISPQMLIDGTIPSGNDVENGRNETEMSVMNFENSPCIFNTEVEIENTPLLSTESMKTRNESGKLGISSELSNKETSDEHPSFVNNNEFIQETSNEHPEEIINNFSNDEIDNLDSRLFIKSEDLPPNKIVELSDVDSVDIQFAAPSAQNAADLKKSNGIKNAENDNETSASDSRIVLQHLPVPVLQSGDVKARCVFCDAHRQSLHHTVWKCLRCDVALCINTKRNCFYEYHNINLQTNNHS